ncbi:MAG: phospholipase D-like domain-containing protein, partial [Steroidobacteraceae bacterium]|nr:phospholipase D-like domain-containing protein [Steroidobacteraceae bacterium]
MENRLFEPGLNCWRSVVSARSAFLVDGEAYFRALHDALARATHQVVVLGWDMHSQVRLVRGETAKSVAGITLEQRLHDVLDDSPDLHVYLLNWDYSAVFLLEREWLPDFSLPWSRHPRLRFETDDELPTGASHHQKVVVIDDAIAFSGGLDLTHARWDTPEHRRHHPERVMPGGEAYGPFHDIQAIVAGDAAASLGDLARERWKRATGELLPAPPALSWQDRWPARIEPSYEDARVAIARTSAPYGGSAAAAEILHGYLDQIRSAQTYLYFENQYLTSDQITVALCERLTEKEGPEIVIVLPREASGWLEEATMGEGRDRSAARLRAADENGRLRLLCPVTREKPTTGINVHAKLLITDDRWIRVGSANLS